MTLEHIASDSNNNPDTNNDKTKDDSNEIALARELLVDLLRRCGPAASAVAIHAALAARPDPTEQPLTLALDLMQRRLEREHGRLDEIGQAFIKTKAMIAALMSHVETSNKDLDDLRTDCRVVAKKHMVTRGLHQQVCERERLAVEAQRVVAKTLKAELSAVHAECKAARSRLSGALSDLSSVQAEAEAVERRRTDLAALEDANSTVVARLEAGKARLEAAGLRSAELDAATAALRAEVGAKELLAEGLRYRLHDALDDVGLVRAQLDRTEAFLIGPIVWPVAAK